MPHMILDECHIMKSALKSVYRRIFEEAYEKQLQQLCTSEVRPTNQIHGNLCSVRFNKLAKQFLYYISASYEGHQPKKLNLQISSKTFTLGHIKVCIFNLRKMPFEYARAFYQCRPVELTACRSCHSKDLVWGLFADGKRWISKQMCQCHADDYCQMCFKSDKLLKRTSHRDSNLGLVDQPNHIWHVHDDLTGWIVVISAATMKVFSSNWTHVLWMYSCLAIDHILP